MQFTAIDISRMTPGELAQRPRPVSQWPTELINVDQERSAVCIASWRRDITSTQEVSARLSECAWDALHLGFHFMLCDLVSIPQQAPNLAELVVEFSNLYSDLHVVTSYDVDPHLMRPWLRHEAYKLLSSRTSLAYLLHKWKLGVPLIGSLVINQVCVRRLGIANFRKDRLPLCDTDQVLQMSISDLHLMDEDPRPRLGATINLDRRFQLFASDALLVYELRLSPQRSQLIAKLRELQTNSITVPSLCVVWAIVDGLSISIRGCDWDVRRVTQTCVEMIEAACAGGDDTVRLEDADGGLEFSLEGAIRTYALLEISALQPADGPENLVVRCLDRPADSREPAVVEAFLNGCLDFACEGLATGRFQEPPSLSKDSPSYTLGFDEHAGPCATREWPYSGID